MSLVSPIPLSVTQTYLAIPSETVITLLDSGASNHCFVERERFDQYEIFNPPRIGHSARKGSTFDIKGAGKVSFSADVEGNMVKISLDGTTYTPPQVKLDFRFKVGV
jgi:hypothetical protein